MFLILFAVVSAKIVELSPNGIDSFVSDNKGFKILTFCDYSLDPCQYFDLTTKNYFGKFEFSVGKVDVRSKKDSEKVEEYGVKDFPSIIYYKNSDERIQYQGSLEPIEIYSTINRLFTGVKHYKNINEIETDLQNEYYVDGLILGINLNDWDKNAEIVLPFIPVGYAESLELQTKFKIESGIVVYKPFIFNTTGSQQFTIFEGNQELEIVLDEYYKDIAWLTPNNHILLKKEKPLIVFYAKISPKENPTIAKYLIKRYFSAVSQYKDVFTVAVAKIDDFTWILDEIGLGSHKNIIMIDDTVNMYVLTDIISNADKVNTKKIEKFVKDFSDKKLEPYLISEPVPENQYENGLKKLVGSTFKQEIRNAKEDIVLLVYSLYDENYSVTVFLFESIAKKIQGPVYAKIEANRNFLPSEFVSYNYPVAFYIKPGYQPQNIPIHIESPTKTLEEVLKFYKGSKKADL